MIYIPDMNMKTGRKIEKALNMSSSKQSQLLLQVKHGKYQ